ncbi:MAG: cbb3-type cytochrome c oxidase subunit I [Chloroflexi bacterium]|nr:cbb3-type cytochrome c oxidase subunit I [Chloroflexota bacterium]
MKNSNNTGLTKFVVASVMFFGWAVIQGATQAQKPVHDFLVGPARIIVGAHTHIALLGWVSLTLVAAVYYLLPLFSGKPIAWPRLTSLIFWVWVIATALNGLFMITIGIRAGNAFAAGVKGPQLEALMGPYMMVIGMISIIQALVILLFVVQVIVSARRTAQ